MAFTVQFLLEVIVVFAFVVTSLFMFFPKREPAVHKIFFSLAVMLGVFVTIIDATSIPNNLMLQTVIAWLGLIPAAAGIIISVAKGRPNVFAKLLAMLTPILGVLGYFFLT